MRWAPFLVIALGATPASAEPPQIALARRLAPLDTRPHPLADDRGRIPVLVQVPGGLDPRTLGLLEVGPGVGAARWPLDRVVTFGAANPSLHVSIGSALRPSLDRSLKWNGIPEYLVQTDNQGTGKGAVLGIVDTGLDITHPAFLDETGHTRIRWMITWGDPRGKHPELEEAYGCTDPDQAPCAIYGKDDIDAILDNQAIQPSDLHDFLGHGTHVASIAGGNGGTGSADVAAKFVGMAPEATLMVGAPSAGGGFADDAVLRATSFIFERADELGMPAVVNLSLGGDFGPHDGTSPLETGLAAMVGDDRPGRVIVVASGNSGGLFRSGDLERLGVHTDVHVAAHAPAEAEIVVPGVSNGKVFAWITFRAGDEVSVGLRGPDGTWIGTVAPGDDVGYDDGSATAGVVNNVHDGKSQITSDTNSAYVAWSGEWEEGGTFAITLEGHGDAQLWVTGQGDAADRAYFVKGTRQGTVNTPASHPRLLAVGCTLNRHAWKPLVGPAVELYAFGPDEDLEDDSLCYFSAGGPTPLGVPKPEIVAPGALVAGAMSFDADPRRTEGSMFDGAGCPAERECYVVQSRYAITSGTSMSAPQVAGAVALLLERAPNLTQGRTTDILQASARPLMGKVSPSSQAGPGALDLRQALAVLADEPVSGGPPDVQQSWWVLGAETARPDASWPVRGTIELRRTDGSIASGLDGSLLRVEAIGGAVIEPVTKVRHGLFRFAVAGQPGGGGSTMRVRVTYDGAPVGEDRVLLVAIDSWAGREAPLAAGGCSCRALGDAGESGRGAWIIGLLALGAMRRLGSAHRPS